ncbi:MAG: YbjN domain-containing protein [Odoribacter sp.]|nr:YbjN domain-containing protein [Odoribacter sp.]
MAEVNMEMGKAIYDSVCSVLDKMGLSYKKIEEDLAVLFGHRGEDMNHNLVIAVNVKQETIQLFEVLPFDINKEKATDVAVAICYVNDRILSGKFTYNMEERLTFEVSQIFSGSLIGEKTIQRMILALAVTVEEYDDKFMALNKGYLKPEDFKIKND